MQHRPLVQTGGCVVTPALMEGKICFSHLFSLDGKGREREVHGMALERRVLAVQVTESRNKIKTLKIILVVD